MKARSSLYTRLSISSRGIEGLLTKMTCEIIVRSPNATRPGCGHPRLTTGTCTEYVLKLSYSDPEVQRDKVCIW